MGSKVSKPNFKSNGAARRKRCRPMQTKDDEQPHPCFMKPGFGFDGSHMLTHKRGILFCLKCASWSVGTKPQRLGAPCNPIVKDWRQKLISSWRTGSLPKNCFKWP